MKCDVVVIGAGPGGYVAAIRLGQLGKKTVIVDREAVGGVCLNWGCIPSKALIHVGKLYEQMGNADALGITVKDLKIDLQKTQKWKQEVVEKLTGGVGQLLKSAGVQIVKGEASFETSNQLKLKGINSGKETIEFTNAIISTGARSVEVPGFEFDGKSVVDSREALDWTKAPKRLLIIGGGVIGMEIGMLYQKFGSQVTVVEMMDQLLPGMDRDIAATITRICKKRGIAVFTSSKALKYEKKKNGLEVSVETKTGKQKIECDVMMVSVGRSPNSKGLGLEKIGVQISPKGFIPVNRKMQSSLPHIYAIGDVAGLPQLAHKASKEGQVAAECIAGHDVEYDVKSMPAAIFTDPEIAYVGLSESEATQKGMDVYTGKFPFSASGRATSTGHSEGFVKVVGEKGTHHLLGVQIIGPEASDLISEASLAIEMGSTVEDLALTVHPHPTLSESVMEAAEASLGKAIHMINRAGDLGTKPKRDEKHV